VEFKQEEDKMIILPREKKIDFQLKTISSEKYPELQKIGEDRFFQISQKDFIEMVTQTSFAVSDDETRYFMNGVYLENEEGELLMVATDGRRLSFIRKGFDTTIPEFNPVIIPPKILNLVKKLSSGEGNISFAVSDKSVFIHFDNQKLSSNLIEGQFPNYKRVIPAEQDFELKVDRTLFMDALRRVSLLVEQKSRRIYLTLSENTILLHSEETDIGVAKEEVACEYSGPEFNIALNCIYLEEPLRVMEDNLIIRLTEPNKAISLFSDPERDYFHIVMPMQID
jgi:DNA polymerase-3 subunit beta